MIGNDSQEANQLIREMRQVGVSCVNSNVEDKIKTDIANLCVIINYNADEETNKSRKIALVAMRDAVCRIVCDKYPDYPRVQNVAGEFFGKDRSLGYNIDSRTKNLLESKDKLFMFYYNYLLSEYVKQAA